MKEFVVLAMLHNLTFMEDINLICIADGTQSVGNSNGSASLHQTLKGILYQTFAFRIKGRGCLIKNQDRWVLEDSTSDAHSLALATRKTTTPITNVGIITLLGSHNELVGIGNASSLLYLLLGSTIHTKRDVVEESIVEKNRLLVHITNELAQVVNA